ncbi:MAG: LysR family transcriptional regulator [Ruminococcaceae bacterium]|nr:LysR family transcriptional regulator [Oscillospiraceae bacterium]
MIEIYLLEQLSAFEKYGTLSKAAEALHISQPALSRSMKKIEDELGVSLFDRDKAKISLNETGVLAAKLANEMLSLNNGMIRRIKAYDRSQRSINIGSCAPFPMSELMPLLQDHFGYMLITSEMAEVDSIESGLLDSTYQIGILNKPTENKELFCQRFISEHLFISVPKTHRLAKREYITFEDFEGESFLLFEHVGCWKELCHDRMKGANFLIQKTMDSLQELVRGSDFPCFTTDAFMQTSPIGENRVAIPIEEPEAYITFYITCLNSYKKKYASFFNSIRSRSIQE